MTDPKRIVPPVQTVVGVLLLLVLGSAPTFAQAPSAAAVAPAADFITFEELRHSDKVESDGRIERVQQVKVLLRDAAAVAELGQIGMMYVDGYGDVRFE